MLCFKTNKRSKKSLQDEMMIIIIIIIITFFVEIVNYNAQSF